MSGPTCSPALQSLLVDNLSIQGQISALKSIKHEVIGHDLRKEDVIRLGIVPVLVQGLWTSASSITAKKRKAQHHDGAHRRSLSRESAWDHMDELRLQCCFIAVSLARVGPPFTAALIEGGILPPLLVSLSPSIVSSRITTETLRTIKVFAETVGKNKRIQPRPECDALCREIYSDSVLGNLAAILTQSIESPGYAEQTCLITQIISETLKEPHHQAAVVRTGLLDLLASRLAIYMRVTSQAPDFARLPDFALTFTPVALASLLDALTNIIGVSFYQTARLLYAEDVRINPPGYGRSSEAATYASAEQYESQHDALDTLLPKLQAVENRAEHQSSRHFPALSSFIPSGNVQHLNSSIVATSRTIGLGDYGSPIIAWLVHLARVCDTSDRLAALRLLVHISKNIHSSTIDGFVDTGNRDRSLAILIVPLIVKMLDDAAPKPTDKVASVLEAEGRKLIREKAPQALARLIEHHKDLQKAAVDAGAIKLVSQLLKKSFDPIPDTAKQQMWNPLPASSHSSAGTSGFIRTPDFSAEQIHQLRCRSAALECLAALAQKDDANRKIVIEHGVLQCLVDSLVPVSEAEPINTSTKGNPPIVLIRACALATSLSRSVSILRTSLIDAGVPTPIFNLLSHHKMNVKIAATAAVTNLLLQFSPMREDLVKAGIVDILCAHSHSDNRDLAVNSLWALKHLLNSSSDETKTVVFEKLDPAWLLKAISAELKIEGTPNVHMPEAYEEPRETESDTLASDDDTTQNDDVVMKDNNTSRLTNHNLNKTEIAARLQAIKHAEANKARAAQNDVSRMQVQALDLLRNFIGEANPTQGVMVDYMLNKFGVDRYFGVLERNISLRVPVPPSGLGSPSPAMSPMPGGSPVPAPFHEQSSIRIPTPPMAMGSGLTQSNSGTPRPSTVDQASPEVLISTLFILIHTANGRPSHRRLVISQSNLMRLILPLFSHSDTRIRVACCWLVHNLSWQEDSSDAISVRGRIADLRALGVEDAVKRLAKDSAVDTRERAKAVVDVFSRFPADESGSSGAERRTSGGGGLNFASQRESMASGPRAWER